MKLLKYHRYILYALCFTFSLVTLSGCAASGKQIKTESLKRTDISGSFTLILYGGNYFEDLETVAFLDREGDGYSFDIFAPAFNYKTIKSVAGEEGLRKAEEFVSGHSSFYQVRMSSIVKDKIGIIGYEVRPLYRPFTYGMDDVLDIWYVVKQDKVVVTIRLKPSVENAKMRDDFR